MQSELTLGDLTVAVVRKDIKNVHLSVHPPTGRVTIAALVSGQYHEMGAADKFASTRVSSAAELDAQLRLPDSGMDVAYRHWSSKRVMVFQEFPRPRESGLGWRCEFTYIPPIGTSDNSVLLPTDERETPVLPGA